MEFNGISKLSEDTLAFPVSVSHSIHLYNSLHGPRCELAISNTSPHSLVDEVQNSHTNNSSVKDFFKYPNHVNSSTSVESSRENGTATSIKMSHSETGHKYDSLIAVSNSVIGYVGENNGHNDSQDECLPENVSSFNGNISHPSSNDPPSPISKTESISDTNGCMRSSLSSPFQDGDRTKMDLDKLDDTIDYVLSVARSDEPCEGMFVLSCRMRESSHISSPTFNSNTPNSGIINSPTVSPAPSPHSNQVSNSPRLVQTLRPQTVFQTNNICNMLSPQPVQRYIVDQTHGILQIATNPTTQCLSSQYNNQTLSFIQICSDSSAPVIQTTQHVTSQIAQPLPTSTHVVFHQGVLHGLQNHTSHQTFSVPHSSISSASLQRVPNPLVSPLKSSISSNAQQISVPSQIKTQPACESPKISNSLPISPPSICVVRTGINNPSLLCGTIPTNQNDCISNIKCKSQDSTMNSENVLQTFRQPNVPICSSVTTVSQIPVSQLNDYQTAQNSPCPKKRSYNSASSCNKKRKISVGNVLSNPSTPNKTTCDTNKQSLSYVNECLEKLKSVDLRSLLSAPTLKPHCSVLPPLNASDSSSKFGKVDEEIFLSQKGLKYTRGALAIRLSKCHHPSISKNSIDAYIRQHLKFNVPISPIVRHSKSKHSVVNESVCSSPEPPSLENHMMALFSKINQLEKCETKSEASDSLLTMFTQSPTSCKEKSDSDRCTPPLSLHHMPNPRLLYQKLSSKEKQSLQCSEEESFKVDLSQKNEKHLYDSSCSSPSMDSVTGEARLGQKNNFSPVNQTISEPYPVEKDKLHVTFSINPSAAASIPEVINRISELLGIGEESISYQVSRSGAQITLDQKPHRTDVFMRSLETELKQQFTPLSLHIEKEHIPNHKALLNKCQNSNEITSHLPASTYSPPVGFCANNYTVLPQPKLEYNSSYIEPCRYLEEPVNLFSLANKKPDKLCKNCDKQVPTYMLQRKWVDELSSCSGVAMRSETSSDFVFCSNDCLLSYSRFFSKSFQVLDSPELPNGHTRSLDSFKQLVLCDLPCSVPVLLQNSVSKCKSNHLKRQCSQGSAVACKRRAPSYLNLKHKKWQSIRWRSFSHDTNRISQKHLTEHQHKLPQSDPSALKTESLTDNRTCVLCSLKRDLSEDGPGRLLPLDLDRWVHINCALWCYEVYETVGGSLNNIDTWLEKALETTCSHCGNSGAGLLCYNPKCTYVFHIPCAIQVGCMFFTDRGMYCHLHRPKEFHPMQLSSLTVPRRVYASRNENSQVARMVHEEDRSCVLRIGSVCLHSIGQLLPHQIDSGYYHSRRNIYPVGLRTSRIYWSMRRPGCRAVYFCEILESNNRPLFKITAVDNDMTDEVITHDTCDGAWQIILSKISDLRRQFQLIHLYPQHLKGEDLYGLGEPHIVRAIESLPGVDSLKDYVFNFGRLELISEMPLAINPSGCARSEPKLQFYMKRSRRDSSDSVSVTHRSSNLPGIRKSLQPSLNYNGFSDVLVTKQQQSSRSQQYRRLKTESSSNVILGRSRIQGLGLFAARDLEQQTMVIEYIGELIRLELANKREKEYEKHNRGIYMFRLDDDIVIDATVCGGLARYINHSCQPNCYAEHVNFGDQSHIVIITNRRIKKGEELCYNYNFDFDDKDQKIPCLCSAVNCRKWMN